MKRESIHHKHEVIYYVPCYETTEGGYPSFTYNMCEATQDEQLAWSLNPDYVLKLEGIFDAKTQPFDEDVFNYNRNIKDKQ